jgi:adenylate kinase
VKSASTLFYDFLTGVCGFFRPSRRGARFVVLLGGPGAGKDTLASRLAPKLGLPELNMGKILRAEIAAGTPIGLEWGPRIKRGELVPDRVIKKLLKRELAKPIYDGGAVLNGMPRTRPQGRFLRWILALLGNQIEAVVFLDVSKEDLLVRLGMRRTCKGCGKVYHLKFMPPKQDGVCDTCGGELIQRDDEKPEAIERRMEEFARTFAPLRRYFESIGLLKVIRSTNEMGPDKVFDDVLFYLEETV